MSRRQAESLSHGERWFRELSATSADAPKIVPQIGVRVECRFLVASESDWSDIQEVLDFCRQSGSAEITEYKTFS